MAMANTHMNHMTAAGHPEANIIGGRRMSFPRRTSMSESAMKSQAKTDVVEAESDYPRPDSTKEQDHHDNKEEENEKKKDQKKKLPKWQRFPNTYGPSERNNPTVNKLHAPNFYRIDQPKKPIAF